ncbi:MAG TPA: hypothetical protein VFI91_09710, partial [Longimicrobiaceae bacterium]|nr:hypothetical protein [Longimicrobiaceae bacterium]
MAMSKPKLYGIFAAVVVIAFFIGFLPQWSKARGIRSEMEASRIEMEQQITALESDLQIARLEGRLGAAMAESLRGNYERARQLMVSFYTDLEKSVPDITDPAQLAEMQAIMDQRFEIVTLLSRAEPESTERLMLMYTRYFAAMDPVGREAPASVTPSPPVEGD